MKRSCCYRLFTDRTPPGPASGPARRPPRALGLEEAGPWARGAAPGDASLRKGPSPLRRAGAFHTPPGTRGRASPGGRDPRLSPMPPSRTAQRSVAAGASALLPLPWHEDPIAVVSPSEALGRISIQSVQSLILCELWLGVTNPTHSLFASPWRSGFPFPPQCLATLPLPSRPTRCFLATDADRTPLLCMHVGEPEHSLCAIRIEVRATGQEAPRPGILPAHRPWAARAAFQIPATSACAVSAGLVGGAPEAPPSLGARAPPMLQPEALDFSTPLVDGKGRAARDAEGAAEGPVHGGGRVYRPAPRCILVVAPGPESPLVLYEGARPIARLEPAPPHRDRPRSPRSSAGLDGGLESLYVHSPLPSQERGPSHAEQAVLRLPIKLPAATPGTVGSHPLPSASLESSDGNPSPGTVTRPSRASGGEGPVTAVYDPDLGHVVRLEGLPRPVLLPSVGGTVHMAGGRFEEPVRLRVSLAWRSELVTSATALLRLALPTPAFLSVLALGLHLARRLQIAGRTLAPHDLTSGTGAAGELFALAASLLLHCGVPVLGAGLETTPAAPTADVDRFVRRFPVLKATAAAPAAPSEPSVPTALGVAVPAALLPLLRAFSSAPVALLPPAAAAAAVQSLHLLQQVLALQATTQADAAALSATLLRPLARALGLPRHATFHGAAGTPAPAAAIAPLAAAAELQRLQQQRPGSLLRLAGTALAQLSAPPGRTFADLTAALLPEAHTVPWAQAAWPGPAAPRPAALLRRLLGALEALSEGPRHLEAAAPALPHGVQRASRALLERMAADGWTQAALDVLLPSLAAALYEALEPCRRDPPPGLSAAAYALLRREDLARTGRGQEGRGSGDSGPPSTSAPYAPAARRPPTAALTYAVPFQGGASGGGDAEGRRDLGVAGPFEGEGADAAFDGMEGITGVRLQIRTSLLFVCFFIERIYSNGVFRSSRKHLSCITIHCTIALHTIAHHCIGH